jgi:hypothetical protein
LRGYPDGYVVNLRRRFDPDYVVLHRASCALIHRYRGMSKNPGGFTERAFRKLCGPSLPEIVDHLRTEFARRDPITKACSRCVPQ